MLKQLSRFLPERHYPEQIVNILVSVFLQSIVKYFSFENPVGTKYIEKLQWEFKVVWYDWNTQIERLTLKNVIPLYHPASPTGNLCDCREGQGVHVSFSRQLNAFRNVSVSHVNSKSDLGTEISTQRHWLDITQLKIKCILSKWKLQSQDPWVTYSEIPAYTGASSCGIVGYEIKCHVYFFDVGGIDGGGENISC